MTYYDRATGSYTDFVWDGSQLVDVLEYFGQPGALTLSASSSTILEIVVPVTIPTGAISGRISADPAIPSEDADLFTSVATLYDESGEFFDFVLGKSSGEYRFSGLLDGTYYAQFGMGGSSPSVPLGYESYFYPSALEFENAQPIVIENGQALVGYNQVVGESTTLRGQLLLDTPSGFVPFLARPGSTTLPAVALYPVGSSPTADDALQQYTYSDPEFGTGEYRFDVPAGSYMLAFGKLATGSGKAGFTALQYYPFTSSVADAEPLELVGGTDLTIIGLLPGFGDVPTGNQFINEITWLASTGVTTGYPDGTFRPLTPVNRDAMAAFLYRFAESPAFSAPGTSPFVDVPTNSQFYKEITWLRSTGISTGYPDSTYRPLVSVGRDAMAAFLYRFFTLPE